MKFKDVSVDFNQKEWKCLSPSQKQFYQDMMLKNYRNLICLVFEFSIPHVIYQLEHGEAPWRLEGDIPKITHSDWDQARNMRSSARGSRTEKRNILYPIIVEKPLFSTPALLTIKEQLL
ncbi:zinc finger protein 514-like [Macrotis lagotis]|uniref:zinc finger protein 514-like n=1 Tax=Macrotis lagotis TaxID=92651 RepID=UPI003D6828D5